MATTLLILISPSSTVLLCEHMQMQSIKKVRCWITAGVSFMALSALFAAHSKINELSAMGTKGYMRWNSNLLWPSMWVEIYLYSKSNYQIKSIVLSGVIAVFIWRKHYFWCHLLYFCVDYDMCPWCLWNDNWNDKITDKSTTGHKWKRCIRYHQFSELNDFFQISASFDKVKHVFVYFKKGYCDVNNHRQAENTPFTIGTFALERSSLPNCRLEYGNGVLSWDWIW